MKGLQKCHLAAMSAFPRMHLAGYWASVIRVLPAIHRSGMISNQHAALRYGRERECTEGGVGGLTEQSFPFGTWSYTMRGPIQMHAGKTVVWGEK